MFPKLLVVGHARHGKDTVCEILRDLFGYSFKSSSEFCAEKVIFPALAPKYGYKTVKECFEDRGNHRVEWYELIKEYNSEDKARLGKEIFKEYDIYCGLRNVDEFLALKRRKVFDISIFVDASQRVPPEASTSMTITVDMCDHIIENNHSLVNLISTVNNFVDERFPEL